MLGAAGQVLGGDQGDVHPSLSSRIRYRASREARCKRGAACASSSLCTHASPSLARLRVARAGESLAGCRRRPLKGALDQSRNEGDGHCVVPPTAPLPSRHEDKGRASPTVNPPRRLRLYHPAATLARPALGPRARVALAKLKVIFATRIGDARLGQAKLQAIFARRAAAGLNKPPPPSSPPCPLCARRRDAGRVGWGRSPAG